MKTLFALDFKKDSKLIGKSFILKDVDKESIIKAKLTEITLDGYYVFKVTTKNTIWDEYSTKVPNNGNIQ